MTQPGYGKRASASKAWAKASLAVVTLVVCLFALGPLSSAQEERRGAVILISAGGAGGTAFEFYCPNDEYVVGARIRSSAFVDAIGLYCAPADPFYDMELTPVAGGADGFTANQWCPRDQYGRGLVGRAGNVIDAVGLICGPFAPDDGSATTRLDLDLRGGGGGQDFELICPDGMVMVGLQGGAGRFVDRVQPICAWPR